MGFGINPAIYTNQDGLYNALGGLQTLAANAAVKARTILTPHIYGFQVTGEPLSSAACPGNFSWLVVSMCAEGAPCRLEHR